jgi:hypothetical protein
MWFNSLQAATASHTDKVFHCVRKLITKLDDGIQQAAPSETPSASDARNSQQATINEVEDEEDQGPSDSNPLPDSRKRPRASSELPFPDPPPRTHPSDYLRSRCPLCFGGKKSYDLKGCAIYIYFIFLFLISTSE